MYKRFTLLASLILFTHFVSFAQTINIDTLAEQAAQQDKHLLVWLHKTDCGYCESMQEFTLEDETVAAMLSQSFLFKPINVYDEDTVIHGSFKGNGKSFAKKVGYSFYPTSLFFDKDAKLIFAAPGYIEERDFTVMLQFIQSGMYKKMGYDCFRRQEGKR